MAWHRAEIAVYGLVCFSASMPMLHSVMDVVYEYFYL